MESTAAATMSLQYNVDSRPGFLQESITVSDDLAKFSYQASIQQAAASKKPNDSAPYYRPSKPSKKRPRTTFNRDQLMSLEARFRVKIYISREEREKLSAELGLEERAITTWFQNRRSRYKRNGTFEPLNRNQSAVTKSHDVKPKTENNTSVPCAKQNEDSLSNDVTPTWDTMSGSFDSSSTSYNAACAYSQHQSPYPSTFSNGYWSNTSSTPGGCGAEGQHDVTNNANTMYHMGNVGMYAMNAASSYGNGYYNTPYASQNDQYSMSYGRTSGNANDYPSENQYAGFTDNNTSPSFSNQCQYINTGSSDV